MNKCWGIVIFSTGTLLGWVIPRHENDASNPNTTAANSTKVARDRMMSPSKTPHPQKWQSLGKRAATFTETERNDFLKNLTPQDRLLALEGLMADGGPKGLSSKTINLMNQILRDWAKADFEDAWGECAKCQIPGLRKFMQSELIDLLAPEDPKRALACLLKLTAEDPEVGTAAIVTLARGEMGKTPEQLLALVTALPDPRTYYSAGLTYPENFDFEKLAEGLAVIYKKSPHQLVGFSPDNVLSAWADRDPEAAHSWWAKNGKFDYNSWGEILNSVEKRSTPEDAAAWLIAKFEEPGAPRDQMIRELSGDSSQGGMPGTINGIARAMPDIAAQDRFLSDVARVNWNALDRDYGFALSGLSSPQARLEVFRKLAANQHVPNLKAIGDAQFQTWGISRAEVEQIFKANQ